MTAPATNEEDKTAEVNQNSIIKKILFFLISFFFVSLFGVNFEIFCRSIFEAGIYKKKKQKVDHVYSLHSVLVHSGSVSGGHYQVFFYKLETASEKRSWGCLFVWH